MKIKVLGSGCSIYLLISVICLVACGDRSHNTNNALANVKADRIEILFFQSPQRCGLCDNIKIYTRELLDSLYVNELANGEIIFRIIDISKKENESLADSYEAVWTSLFVNRWNDGKEMRYNMTEYAISHSMHPAAEFKGGLKNKIEKLRTD